MSFPRKIYVSTFSSKKFIAWSFFTKMKTIHKNKFEIHKIRTVGKKPGQTAVFIIQSVVYIFTYKNVGKFYYI